MLREAIVQVYFSLWIIFVGSALIKAALVWYFQPLRVRKRYCIRKYGRVS